MKRQAAVVRGLAVLCSVAAVSCARVGDPAVEVATGGEPTVAAREPATPASSAAEVATSSAPEPVIAAPPLPVVRAAAGDAEAAVEAKAPEQLPEQAAASTLESAAERAEPPATAVVEAALPAALATSELEPPGSVVRPAAETLDFKGLVTRLRKTKAINLSTKLSVKNLSDDLLEDFRAYHTQHGTVSLVELRRSYDSLFQRLHSLLHDADPLLDRDIDRSRAALWEILADPRKFSAANLMAGA